MELQKFIGNNQDWESLLKQKPYNVDIHKNKSFRVMTYTFKSILKTIAKHCRGTIVDTRINKIVCMPFDKFGHHNQDFSDKIDIKNCKIFHKYDGSIIKIWFNKIDNEWMISSNNRVYLDDKLTKLFKQACNFDLNLLDKDFTHMFELISPHNRIIIDYKQTELIYLMSRHNDEYYEKMFDYEFVKELKQLIIILKLLMKYMIISNA